MVALLLAWPPAGGLSGGPCGGLGVMFGVGVSATHSPSLANVAPAYDCSDPGWERSQLSPPGKQPKMREDLPSNDADVLCTQRLGPTSNRSCVSTTLLLQEQWELMMFPR